MNRSDAADPSETDIPQNGSRRRRGCHVAIPRRRGAPQVPPPNVAALMAAFKAKHATLAANLYGGGGTNPFGGPGSGYGYGGGPNPFDDGSDY